MLRDLARQPLFADCMATGRNRGRDPTPTLLSASVADILHSEPARRACDVSGMPCGRRSGRGTAVIDSAIQAPEGVEDSSRGFTPDRGAATTDERGFRGCRGASSDQPPSFDLMAMVRGMDSEPAPTPPRSAPLVDLPHSERAQRRTDANERLGLQRALDEHAGACETSSVACSWASEGGNGMDDGLRPGNPISLTDTAIPAPTGVSDSSRGGAPERRARTVADRRSIGTCGSVSYQLPPLDVMAMVRNHGSEPTPPAPSPPPTPPGADCLHGEPARGSSPAATSNGTSFEGRESVDTAGPQKKNCYVCGRQKQNVSVSESALWACGGKKCGRWACGVNACSLEVAVCCYCDQESAYGCHCFK